MLSAAHGAGSGAGPAAAARGRRAKMAKMLIVYYSWARGNTERVAKLAQKATGADIARIETAVPYTGSYDEVVEQGEREVKAGFRPELKPLDVDLDDYDVVAVGTPTWWYTMAPAVSSFLSGQSWTGRTVVPFMTNGGWPGNVIRDMKAACSGAGFACEMQVQFDSEGGSELVTPKADLDAWCLRLSRLI